MHILFTPSGGDIVLNDRVFMNCEHDHIGIVLEYKSSTIIVAEGNTFNDNISRIMERNKDEHIRPYIRIPENFNYYKNEPYPWNSKPIVYCRKRKIISKMQVWRLISKNL